MITHYQGLKPQQANPGDAGYDLTAQLDSPRHIWPGQTTRVNTGLRIAMPDYLAALVLPRSGLASKHGIAPVNSPGLIDSGFRGEIQVALINHGDAPFVIEPGMRIAQLVFVRVEHPEWVMEGLDPSLRGEGGFGSSGL